MEDLKILINEQFLPVEEFDRIQSEVMGSQFPWYKQECGVSANVDKGGYGFQFTHQLRNVDRGTSHYNDLFTNLYMRLGVKRLFRSKLNLLYRTKEIHEFKPFHVDLNENNPPWSTAIFYMNTNNGYTLFEDGTKVDSVANRLVEFEGHTFHTGSTHTIGTPCHEYDEGRFRVVLNINFLR